MDLKKLWENVLKRYAKTAECSATFEDLKKLDALGTDHTRDILDSMEKVLLVEKPLNRTTLERYHRYFRGAEQNKPGSRPKTIQFLQSYSGERHGNPLGGAWLSYQFAQSEEKLAIKNDFGEVEYVAAARILWILFPNFKNECRVIGYSYNRKKFKGTAQIKNDTELQFNAREEGVNPREMNFRLVLNDTDSMQGTQILSTKSENNTRRSYWTRISSEFDSSVLDTKLPRLFRNIADLPEVFQKYVITTAKEEEQINPEDNKTIEQETPLYVAEKDDLKAQNETSQEELAGSKGSEISSEQAKNNSFLKKVTLIGTIGLLAMAYSAWTSANNYRMAQKELIDYKNAHSSNNNQDSLIAKYKSMYEIEYLWSGPPPIEKEKALKDSMRFVEDPEFKDQIIKWVELLKTQHDNPKLPEMAHGQDFLFYKRLKFANMRPMTTYPYQSYYFDKSFATWWVPYGADTSLLMENRVKELFGVFVDTLQRTSLKEDIKGKDSSYVQKFLRIKGDKFFALSIFSVFKNPSTTIMVRYPPYNTDNKQLENYLLTTRQWWKDNFTQERNDKLGWHWKNGNIRVALSRPFSSIRDKMRNQRVLIVNIPLKKDTMMICINLILKNE